MGVRARVEFQPAFLLHQRAFSDSSRILELITHDHGRVALFARGVRRAGNPLAALLQPFVPLSVSWSGPGDGGTLRACEPAGPRPPLPAAVLMSGFYLNELVMRVLAREDPHPDIFEAYVLALGALGVPGGEARALRLFEKRLLEALGFGIDYAHLAGGGEAVRADAYYHVRAEHGVVGEAVGPGSVSAYAGHALLSLAAEELADAESLAAARRLLGAALEQPLDGREIRTRRVARALRGAGRRPPLGARNGDGNEES
jgi:DNA repair protein RecO (recombination protein O)